MQGHASKIAPVPITLSMWTCSRCWSTQWATNAWCSKCWSYKNKKSNNGGGKGRGSWARAQSSSPSSPEPSPSSPSPTSPTGAATVPSTDQRRSPSPQHASSVHEKKLEKDLKASIGRLTNSLKCLPLDAECTPGVLAVKTLMVEQLAKERENLRALKPLDTRLKKTKEFVADKVQKLTKVREQLTKLLKDEAALVKTIATNTDSIKEMQRLFDEDVTTDECGDLELAELLKLALSSNNEKAKSLAQSVLAKKVKLEGPSFVEDSGDDMDAADGDPYEAVSGYNADLASWDQMFSHLSPGEAGASTIGGSKAASSGHAATASLEPSFVKGKIDKIQSNQRGQALRGKLLAQANKACQKAAANKLMEQESAAVGFPQIGMDPEEY